MVAVTPRIPTLNLSEESLVPPEFTESQQVTLSIYAADLNWLESNKRIE